MTPQFLYFDLGNVLLTFDNQRMCRQMAAVLGVSEEKVRRSVFAAGDATDLQWRLESGLVSEAEYHSELITIAAGPYDRAALEHAMSDIFGPIEATMQLAMKLRQRGYRLGLLSNTNSFHWRFVLDGRYPALRDAFEIEVTSFGTRAMKPDPRIYEHAIERCGVERERVFFTDDRPENVAGAIAVGIDAAPFVSTEQLVQDLRIRGVEVD